MVEQGPLSQLELCREGQKGHDSLMNYRTPLDGRIFYNEELAAISRFRSSGEIPKKMVIHYVMHYSPNPPLSRKPVEISLHPQNLSILYVLLIVPSTITIA